MVINLKAEKEELISYWLHENILTDKRIIAAFRKVPRENFIHKDLKSWAYLDQPLEIGAGQTISQPTTVAIMTQALEPAPGNKILEVGAGSGYQAAILANVVGPKGKIVTIERVRGLYAFAKKNLKSYKNITIAFGDALEEIKKYHYKFDRIIVTAAAERFPDGLFAKLKEGGIMVVPIGPIWDQHVFKFTKIKGKKYSEDLGHFIFVPLVSGKVL